MGTVIQFPTREPQPAQTTALFMRLWLQKCIASLEQRPPSTARDLTLNVLRERLDGYAATVVPLFGREV